MTEVYFMVGLPGSGKSTYIKNNLPSLPIVSRDIIRAELGFIKSVDQKRVLKPKEEEYVSQVERETVRYFCENDQSFVVDDMNNRYVYRKAILDIIRVFPSIKIICIKINTPLETCVERRQGQINSDSMQYLSDSFEEIQPDEFDEIIEVG